MSASISRPSQTSRPIRFQKFSIAIQKAKVRHFHVTVLFTTETVTRNEDAKIPPDLLAEGSLTPPTPPPLLLFTHVLCEVRLSPSPALRTSKRGTATPPPPVRRNSLLLLMHSSQERNRNKGR